jgi:hypothetical protein
MYRMIDVPDDGCTGRSIRCREDLAGVALRLDDPSGWPLVD